MSKMSFIRIFARMKFSFATRGLTRCNSKTFTTVQLMQRIKLVSTMLRVKRMISLNLTQEHVLSSIFHQSRYRLALSSWILQWHTTGAWMQKVSQFKTLCRKTDKKSLRSVTCTVWEPSCTDVYLVRHQLLRSLSTFLKNACKITHRKPTYMTNHILCKTESYLIRCAKFSYIYSMKTQDTALIILTLLSRHFSSLEKTSFLLPRF